MTSTIHSSLAKGLSILILVGIWKIISLLLNSEIILPSPEKAAGQMWDIFCSDKFWPAVAATVARGLAGFGISLVVGVAVGLLAGFNAFFRALSDPLIQFIRSIPLMSIILLALIWFKKDWVAVFVSFLIAFPIICSNVIEGVRNADQNLVQMARLYKIKPWRVLTEIYLPSIAPYLLAGASTALGMNWKVIVSAEVLSQPVLAVGTQLELAKVHLETARLFAWTAVAIMLSFFFEFLLRTAAKKLPPGWCREI
ncbi:MAG: ABC transporter permease subunit [Firmicutes bacterium]|nr:ABC transporter permease subunit [Bacillota bacterium]